MEQLLALEMVRVTEAAAIESARFMGRGDRARGGPRRHRGDARGDGRDRDGRHDRHRRGRARRGADAVHRRAGRPPRRRRPPAIDEVDIAVDPLEGTNLVATGQANAITVLAASENGGLVHAPDTYLEKLCVGPVAAGHVDITRPPTENVRRIAEALGRKVERHHRHHPRPTPPRRRSSPRSGAPARASSSSPTATSRRPSAVRSPGTGVHAVMGIGGAPEGVITAAALRCLGGEIQARFRYPQRRGARARRADGPRRRVAGLPHGGPRVGRLDRVRGDRRHRRATCSRASASSAAARGRTRW